MRWRVGRWFSRFELSKFKNIDFCPPRSFIAADIAQGRICIGTKARTIGDALLLSTLPGKLKSAHPNLTITTYPRGFNPVIFEANPHVSSLQYLPDRVFGDDASWGEGHLIQLKERYFDLPVEPHPKPEIYLTPEEIRWAREATRSSATLPLAVIHPWGHTWQNVFPAEAWGALVSKWRGRIRFCQVGMENHVRIPGCDLYLLTPRGYWHARKLFAMVSRARMFLGVNSGPMHVARAFDLPSLVFTEEGNLEEIFLNRHRGPYFLFDNHERGFLYEENSHVSVPETGITGAQLAVDEFLARQLESAKI